MCICTRMLPTPIAHNIHYMRSLWGLTGVSNHCPCCSCPSATSNTLTTHLHVFSRVAMVEWINSRSIPGGNLKRGWAKRREQRSDQVQVFTRGLLLHVASFQAFYTTTLCSSFVTQEAIKNWRCRRPGNEATLLCSWKNW